MNIGLSQRDAARVPSTTVGDYALFVFRNFTAGVGRYSDEFSVTDLTTNITTTGLRHGRTFMMPAGNLLNVRVVQTSGDDTGDTGDFQLQPYSIVAPEYDIFHFFHEQESEVTWAIGSRAGNPNTVCVLRSNDYFTTCTELWSTFIATDDVNYRQYRSLYVDRYGNVIIGWRPGPMISRDGGTTFEALPFHWVDPFHGLLSPFWNITEDDDGTMVISEYGDSLAATEPNGSHRGTFWSTDSARMNWTKKVVDGSFGPNIDGGYFRHIHGYHINPELPNVHHMFLGDPALNQPSDGTPGYYISQDAGLTWSTEILVEFATAHDPTVFFNAPCFVTWWPSGEAFITSDTAQTGHAYWWGSGPNDWGGPAFNPSITLDSVDEESTWPCTPWMAMSVSENETYCTTALGPKEILWRYDHTNDSRTVIAEAIRDSQFFVTLRWLSGSRHNRIPAAARYFFTSGNRRFPRPFTPVLPGCIPQIVGHRALSRRMRRLPVLQK